MYKFENSFLKLLVRPLLSVWTAAILSITAISARAQLPPANDNLADAQTIAGPTGTTSGDNLNATLEPQEPAPTDDASNNAVPDATIWYAWKSPFSGIVSFNTSGSTLSDGGGMDTVLAVYTNTVATNAVSVTNLTEVVSNDQDPLGGDTSRVTFTATAGRTYYIQVDDGNFQRGNIVLNWAPALTSGTFHFAKPVFIMSENEQRVYGDTPPGFSDTVTKRKGYISITRSNGYTGRVNMQVVMTPGVYTNIFITNAYGTNIFITNYTGSVIATNNTIIGGIFAGSTNIYSTNYYISNRFQNIDENGSLNYRTVDILSSNVTVTVTSTKIGAAFTLTTNAVTNSFACTMPDISTKIARTQFSSQTDESNAVLIVTNFFYAPSQTTNLVASAVQGPAADFSTNDLPKNIVFDDFEMTKTFPVTNFPTISLNFLNDHFNMNRWVNLSLTNVLKDKNELDEIAQPTQGGDAKLAIMSLMDRRPKFLGDNCVNYSIFNWELMHYNTAEKGSHDIIINVLRTGDYALNNCTFSYEVASLTTGAFDDNGFDLNVGSEYATPNKDFTPVIGTISWAGTENVAGKQVTIPELSDTLVEFNEDIKMQLFLTPAQATAQPFTDIGFANYCLITIPFDDMPAGAVDVGFNPDNGSSSYPPFNAVPGANKPVRSVVVQPDGKTIIGGTFTAFDSVTNNRIARLLANGLPDSTFTIGSGANDFISAMALDDQGRVVIAGGFTSFNGTNRYHVARLLPSGILDTNFHPQFGANGTISAVTIQPDGRILIGGMFTSFDNTNRARIARLNIDGSLDATFDPGVGADGNVNAIGIQSTGDIVIGGEFTAMNGTSFPRLARVHSDGSLDAAFAPGTGADGTVFAIGIATNDAVVVGGSFKQINLISRPGLARLNADGTLDTTFNPGAGANDAVYALQIQTDGTVVFGGLFTSYDQTRRIGLARVYDSGTLDTTFIDTAYNQFAGLINHLYNTNAVTTNADDLPSFGNTRNAVFSLAVDPVSGGYVIGGSFSRIGGGGSRNAIHPRLNVARVLGGSTPGPGNIIFTQDQFTVDENAGPNGLYVSLVRTNGTLGRVGLTFDIDLLTQGPGSISAGDFPTNQSLTQTAKYNVVHDDWRIYPIGSYGWQLSDGYYGPNYRSIPADLTRITTADLFVGVQDNQIVEQNRFADLSLSQPTGIDTFFLGGENIPLGVGLGRSSGKLEIVDDDFEAGTLGFAITNFTVVENAVYANVTVTRTNGSAGQVTVQFTTANGSAIEKKDYSKTNGVLTFADGVLTQSFQVRIFDNFIAQSNRFFNVVLSSPTGRGTINTNLSSAFPSQARVTIIDNDYGPGHLDFSTDNYRVLEGGGVATVTINRTGGNTGALTVTCMTTVDGSASNPATGGLDYTIVSTNLVWNNADSSSKTVQIPIIQDTLVEGDETFRVVMTNAFIGVTSPTDSTNANILGQSSIPNAVVTIVDDDSYGTPNFLSPNFNVMENAGYAIVTVVRQNGTAGTVSVNYTTGDGTAFAPGDYTPTNGLLTFNPGETSKTFSVPIRDNTTQDGNRVLNLQLYNPSPAVAGFPKNATLTIIDDESVNTPAGSVDTSETADFNDYVHAITLQPDGKILAGGDFTAVSTFPKKRIARLNPDGSVDNTFQFNMAGANGAVRSVVSQTPAAGFTNGSAMIAGAFTQVNGVNRNGVARLNIDGSNDETFDPGSGADGPVFSLKEVHIGSARKYLIAGALANYNGVYCGGIARLNETGTLDTTFSAGLGITSGNAAIYSLAVQPDGLIVVGGDFTSFNGVTHHHLVRLNLDGSLDSSFNPDPGLAGSVRAVCLQTDGKILVGGLFTTMNGTNYNHIARLNPDGTLDTSFNVTPGASDTVLSIAIDSEGKILVGGEFTTASGVTRNRLTRLNPDGTVDPTINFGIGANNFVEAIAVQPDAAILVAGGFTTFDGIAADHLARIAGGGIAGSGLIEFVSANYSVSENATNALITFRRIGGTGSSNAVTSSATFFTLDGTAHAGVDYIGVTNTVTFPLGETFETVLVPVLDNTVVDGDRTVSLNLADLVNSGIGNQPFATLTILNDDSALAFAATGYREAENVIGGNARISIVRLGSLLGSVSVTAQTTTNGTAVAGVRYTPATNTFTFAPGETNKTFLVPLINDTLIEGDQTVGLQLINPINGFLTSPNQATLTIAEDDSGPGVLTFAATNYVVGEGNSIDVTILRTNGITGPISVNLMTVDGTATAGQDYLSTNVAVNFADGEFSKTITIQTLQDTQVEPTESAFLVLTNVGGGATIGTPNVVELDILDDDLNFSFGLPAYFVNEGGGAVTISVLRNSGTNGSASVDYTTTNSFVTNGIAAEGVDYTKTFGTLNFAPGETLKTITVPILQDNLVEGSEIFQVILRNPTSGAQIGVPGVTAVTIVDDDTAFAFGSITNVVNENGTNALITINRINVAGGAVSVAFSTSDGTATANVDYLPVSRVLNFDANQSTTNILIPIIDDSLVEGDETINLTLSSPSANAAILTTNAVLTIIDNDIGFRFSSPDYRVSESGVSASISVLRIGFTNALATVDFATSNATAIAGSDFVFTNGTLTFQPGETNKTFNVGIIDDTIIEGDETALLNLSNPSTNAVLLTPNTASLTIVDNDGSLVVAAGTSLLSENFSPANNTIDPGETVSLYFAFRSIGGGNTTNLIATLVATNGVSNPSAPQSYGVVVQNGPAVSRVFSFTANGTNTQSITATFKLWDVAGASSNFLGVATFSFNLGSTTASFTNLSQIMINDSATPPTKASPYPSVINVAGVVGALTQVKVSISNYAHQFPDDVGILLVGPANQKALLMTDAGGGISVTNINLTFDDTAATSLPDSTQISSGTNKPSNYKTNFLLGSVFPSVGPPASTNLSVFSGTNPNGAWGLYVIDDQAADSGVINGGWSLNLITANPVTPFADLLVTMTAAPAQATVSNLLTYTITVTNYGPSGATNIVLTDVLPTGVTYVGNTLNGTPSTNGVLTSTIVSLAKDAGLSYTITVVPNAVSIISNTITGLADQTDADLTNNTAVIVSTVATDSANLNVQITGTPNPMVVGGTVTYTIISTNAGPSVANNTIVTNVLPAGLTFVSASASQGSISTNGSTVLFSLGDFSASSGANVATMTVIARANTAGTNTVSVSVGSSILDPLRSDNFASIKTEADVPGISAMTSTNGFILTWPANAGSYTLQGTTNLLAPINWITLTNPPPVLTNGVYRYTVTNSLNNTNGYHFFRLVAPAP